MLVEYARWHGRMMQSRNGAPLHAHLTRALQGRRPSEKARQELRAPPIPSSLRYLWDWTVELISGVAPNGMGSIAVSWRDIQAWAQLTARSLAPWETRAVFAMAGSYVSASMPPKDR